MLRWKLAYRRDAEQGYAASVALLAAGTHEIHIPDTDYLGEVGEWVLREACREAAS